jgi:c-di-GMP-binding flagellar brake protein YcgR
MAKSEKIEGDAVFNILEELKQNNTLLKIKVVGQNFEHLTMITDLKKGWKTPRFSIDSPEGLPEALSQTQSSQIQFEFIGKDKIRCVFTTRRSKTSHGRIWLDLPSFIERYQRRKLFRIEAPAGTRLHFQWEGAGFELLLINVSIGGILGALARFPKSRWDTPGFQDGQLLTDLILKFPTRDGSVSVNVAECIIRRVAKNTRSDKLEVALEFTSLDAENEQRLTRMIYKFQRQQLRRRRIYQVT